MSAVSVSFVQGEGALAHNNREYINKNVDVERIKNNINYKNETLEDAYKKCFGDSVERYNSKQKRNDRKIDDYLDQVKKSKNNEKPFYETIVQVGDKNTNPVGTLDGDRAKNILDEYARTFQERNPNLYVFNMKMHLDEATPHLHIDYIPVATGYKQGLDTRNSLTKAHQNMGIDKGTGKNDNSTMKWQDKERGYLRGICEKHKVKVIDKNVNREHLTVDEYKVQVEKIEKLYYQNMNKDTEKINVSSVPLTDKKIISSDDLDKLLKNAKIKEFSESKISSVFNQINIKEKELNTKLLELAKERDSASKALKRFREQEIDELREKEKYENKYNEQLTLNQKYDELKEKFDLQNVQLEEYKADKENLAYVNANLMKAFNLLAYDDEEYKVDLNKKQMNLVKGLENYTKSWLKSTGYDDLAKEVEEKMGISKGIEKEIKEITRSMSRGYER